MTMMMMMMMMMAIVIHEYVVLQSLYRTVPGIGVYFCTLHYITHRFKYVWWFFGPIFLQCFDTVGWVI